MKAARKLLIALTALLALSVAGSALAVTDVDWLTSRDIGASVDGVVSYQHIFDPGPGLTVDDVTVESVWLYVGVIQWTCGSAGGCAEDLLFEADQVQTAKLDLTGVGWSIGRATVQILWGDITTQANLEANEGLLDVAVSSDCDGVFAVVGSKMVTTYTWDSTGGTGSGGVNAIPEPSAALVFAFGALIMTRGVRRNLG
jgi:hypothetical protein